MVIHPVFHDETSGYQMRLAGFRLQANRSYCIAVYFVAQCVYWLLIPLPQCLADAEELQRFKAQQDSSLQDNSSGVTDLSPVSVEVKHCLGEICCMLFYSLHPFLMLCCRYLLLTTFC